MSFDGLIYDPREEKRAKQELDDLAARLAAAEAERDEARAKALEVMMAHVATAERERRLREACEAMEQVRVDQDTIGEDWPELLQAWEGIRAVLEEITP